MDTEERRILAGATRLGIPVETYRRYRADGLKWCTGCKDWHGRAAFGLSSNHPDLLQPVCREYRNRVRRKAP